MVHLAVQILGCNAIQNLRQCVYNITHIYHMV